MIMLTHTPISVPYKPLPDDTPYTNTPSDFAKRHKKGGEGTHWDEVHIWCHAMTPIVAPSNRMERAANLAHRRDVTVVTLEPATGDVVTEVRSSKPGKPYLVTIRNCGKNMSCECPDEPPDGYCKHMLASAMRLVYGDLWTLGWDEMPMAKTKLNLALILLSRKSGQRQYKEAAEVLRRRFEEVPLRFA